MLVDLFLICLWQFYFWTQSVDYSKAIAFALRPLFKMDSFLEYQMFFPVVFWRELV